MQSDGKERIENVRADYAEAVVACGCLCSTNAYEEMDLSFIPREVIDHNQGCSSPITEFADALHEGMQVVDLGCGAGLDVFIASKHVGESGRVTGIDMTPEMLNIARAAAPKVGDALGYAASNVVFCQAQIEKLPLEDSTTDFVMSNCVINLSADKHAVFKEIFRILKPGGRFFIADVFALAPVPAYMREDRRLVSLCIGDAMERDVFFEVVGETGFDDVRELSEAGYETVDGIVFVSAVMTGRKPLSICGDDI